MKVLTLLSCMLVVISFLSGCKSTSEKPVRSDTIPTSELQFDEPPFALLPVPQPEDLFALQDAQKAHFLAYFHHPEQQHVSAHQRLYNYLNDILDGFHFQGKTYTASQALEMQSGNCLSLAILTTALARLVELDFSYQRVNSSPVYHRYHNVMTLSSHVRTHLHLVEKVRNKEAITMTRSSLIIDYFPQSGNVTGDRVEYADFIAMFYQNLAGDALVQENFPLAYSLLYRGWKLSADNPETLNTFAVLFNKMGQAEKAESIYAYAVKNDLGTVNILSNYHLLLAQQGREAEAKTLEQAMQHVEDDNPYRWFDIADRQFAKSNYAIALKYYKRALQEAPYMHEGYFGLAKIYYSLGQEDEAKKALNRALELTYVPKEQRLYMSKLQVLESTMVHQ